MRTTMTQKLLTTTLKIGLSAAVILLIAWLIVAQGATDSGVKTARADIFSMELFGPRSKSQRFAQTLKSFELEPPRMYTWNDNTFFYSMGSTDLTPEEFLDDFQRSLLENGVNRRMHTRLMPGAEEAYESGRNPKQKLEALKDWGDLKLEELDDFFSGGLIPIERSKNRVAMVAAQSPDRASDARSFIAEQTREQRSIDESSSLMRYVEAWREPGDRRTTIAAVWSDDDLDISKFATTARADLSKDAGTPACLGCDKTMSFRGSGDEKKFGTEVFLGRQNVALTMAEYDRLLAARGWRLSQATQTARLLEAQRIIPMQTAQVSSFSKGSDFVTVLAYPVERGTRTQVHVFSSP